MPVLITTVFLASLVGSLHCAGMCGAFVAFATGLDGPVSAAARARLHAAYNAGRLVTYVSLGAVAGTLGGLLDLAGSLVGLQRAAAIGAGAVLVLFGGAALARAAGVRVARIRPPKALESLLRIGHRAAMTLPSARRALVIGLLTTLLPCGWLYAFLASAAGTGEAWLGAITMAAFWAGTLPMLVSIGAGVRALAGPLGKRLPVLAPLAIVVVGLCMVVSRAVLPVAGLLPKNGQPVGVVEAADHAASLDASDVPCCEGSGGDGEH